MPRKRIEPSITGDETEEWYTAGDAAKVLTINSNKTIPPDYLSKLGYLGKVRTKRLSARVTLYYKPDVDLYRVAPRGEKSGQAKRKGKTGPTVRESRQAAKEAKKEVA